MLTDIKSVSRDSESAGTESLSLLLDCWKQGQITTRDMFSNLRDTVKANTPPSSGTFQFAQPLSY